MIKELKKKFSCVKFINLSVSALGVSDNESAAFTDMLERLDVNKNHLKYYTKKVISIIAIRSTYMDKARLDSSYRIMCIFVNVFLLDISPIS